MEYGLLEKNIATYCYCDVKKRHYVMKKIGLINIEKKSVKY